MGFLFKVIVTGIAAYLAAWLLPGVNIADAKTTLLVALVLALLNTFIKPILVVLTIPLTVLTLGLFLIVINIIIVYLATAIVPGFTVDGWLSALLFSLVVAFVSWILEGIASRD